MALKNTLTVYTGMARLTVTKLFLARHKPELSERLAYQASNNV